EQIVGERQVAELVDGEIPGDLLLRRARRQDEQRRDRDPPRDGERLPRDPAGRWRLGAARWRGSGRPLLPALGSRAPRPTRRGRTLRHDAFLYRPSAQGETWNAVPRSPREGGSDTPPEVVRPRNCMV